MGPQTLLIENEAQLDERVDQMRASAARLQAWCGAFGGDGVEFLRALKFDQVGCHPLEDRAINAVEQVNQTWTYLVALAAVRELLRWHPQAGGFRIAPGAHAAQLFDVMSVAKGQVGAETFAAVNPKNNDKLNRDLVKLVGRSLRHRYVFFASPLHPGTARRPELERDGIQVWSVDV